MSEREGDIFCPLQPPRCTHGDTEASGRGQLVMVTQLGSHSPGPLSLRLPIAGL